MTISSSRANLKHNLDEKAAIRILGIDPGLQITGYAVLEAGSRGPRVCEAGVVRSGHGPSTPEIAQRVQALYDGIEEVIHQLRPAVVAMERLYSHYAHPRTAILMAHARGVLLLAAARHGLSVAGYHATQIKKTITGSGRARKDQVQRTVQRELGLAALPEPPDVADALAVALCHLHAQKGRAVHPPRSSQLP